jgi:hypothetical protein
LSRSQAARERAELGFPQDGRRLLGESGRLHTLHRVVPDLSFLDELAEEGVAAAVAIVGSCGLPMLEDVGDECLDVLTANVRRVSCDTAVE